jgi:hypothetical protein
MTKTYNRQDGETTKAYTAFTTYRDMGSARSLDAISLIIEPIHQALKVSDGVVPRDKIDILFASQLAAKNLMLAATSGAELTARGLVIEQLLESIESEIDVRSKRI